MSYRIAPFSMTVSDLQDYSPTASHLNSYRCAARDNISIDKYVLRSFRGRHNRYRTPGPLTRGSAPGPRWWSEW